VQYEEMKVKKNINWQGFSNFQLRSVVLQKFEFKGLQHFM
jgi:hypothetical protein